MIKINILLVTTLLGTLLLTSSFETQAQKSDQQKHQESKGKKVLIKCYVEYSGGGEAIHTIIGKFKNPNQAKKVFQGREMRVGADKASKQIYKVNECVNNKDEFTSASAKRLDEDRAR